MAKEESSSYSTSLELGQIRQILSRAASGAEVEPLRYSPLDDPPDVGVLVAKRMGVFKKLAAVQILADDYGDYRQVQFVALGTSAFENFSTAMEVRNESLSARAAIGRELPDFGSSKKLVTECVSALQAADSQCRRTS